jgi:spore germination protein KA
MTNHEITHKNIIYPLMNADLSSNEDGLIKKLKTKVICTSDIKISSAIDDIIVNLLSGDTILIVDGFDDALIINTRGWQTRQIAEPESERTIRGPKEGFTESIIINLSLLRRRIKNSNLKFKVKQLGIQSKTKICISYIEGIADEKILMELENRLGNINIDAILDSAYIQELIMDSPLLPFKTIGNTERPDVVAAKLLEGRIAVLVDGTPTVLTLPYVFLEYFQSNEDYYSSFYYGSINRLLRVIGVFISTSIPAIYVAISTYHQELIPTPLLLSISAARQGVPFPTIIEVILMLFVFEIIREASTRMPAAIGNAISIVGALVLGQSAVEARVISAPVIIVVGFTGITGLIAPKLKGSIIIMRLIFILAAAFLGLYGYIFCIIGLLIMLFSMRSFGVPYMLEIGSIKPNDLKDTIIRAPWWYMEYRPGLIAAKNNIRQSKKKKKES